MLLHNFSTSGSMFFKDSLKSPPVATLNRFLLFLSRLFTLLKPFYARFEVGKALTLVSRFSTSLDISKFIFTVTIMLRYVRLQYF